MSMLSSPAGTLRKLLDDNNDRARVRYHGCLLGGAMGDALVHWLSS